MGLPRAEPRPEGNNDRKANLGSMGEDSSNKGAAWVERASGAWDEQSELTCPDSINECVLSVLSFCHY